MSLDIYKRELFCLLGGSGCGKTTLLRMLAGFEEPTAGNIFIDGVNMADIPPYERPVNMMFQSYALFPHMTVEQNVAFGLRQDRRPRHEITRRVITSYSIHYTKLYDSSNPYSMPEPLPPADELEFTPTHDDRNLALIAHLSGCGSER